MIILCGKSGSGKDFSRNILVKLGYSPSIAYTSRPMRENEINGIDYNFIKEIDFLTKIDNNFFFEHRAYTTIVNGKEDLWYYGTSNVDVFADNSVMVKDLDGAFKIKDARSKRGLETKIVYIHVDDAIREERAKTRGSFCEKEWNRRLEADKNDFKDELINKCDYIINNTKHTDNTKELEEALLKI